MPRLSVVPEAYRPPLVRDRAGLLREMASTWAELDQFVGGLADSDFMRQVPGLGEGADSWTVKDVVVHLAAWRRNATRVAALQAEPGARRVNQFPGRVLGYSTNDFNARLLDEWRERPVADVLDEHRASYEALRAAIERVPEANLLVRGRSVLWLTPALGHPRLHLLDLRRAV